MAYRHDIRIRYGEVDMQGVVFNAHYLTYCDDAADTWLRMLPGGLYEGTWDIMVKKIEITWHGPAGFGDVLGIDVDARRFGTKSFDIGFDGTVDGRPVFTAIATYIAVKPGTTETIPVPDDFRRAATADA